MAGRLWCQKELACAAAAAAAAALAARLAACAAWQLSLRCRTIDYGNLFCPYVMDNHAINGHQTANKMTLPSGIVLGSWGFSRDQF